MQVFRAEWDGLCEEIGRSGHRLSRVGLILLFAGFILFWALGALIFAAVVVVSLRIPLWASALTIGGILLAAGLLLGRHGWRSAKALESPAVTVRRRVEDHALWWQERVLSAPSAEESEPPAESESLEDDG